MNKLFQLSSEWYWLLILILLGPLDSFHDCIFTPLFLKVHFTEVPLLLSLPRSYDEQQVECLEEECY